MTIIQKPLLRLMMFVVLAYTVAWGIWWVGIVNHSITSISDAEFAPYLLAGSFSPTIAAIIVTALHGGFAAVRTLFQRLLRIRMHWSIYLFVFTAFPVIGIGLYAILSIPNTIPLWQIMITLIPLAPINALLGGIVFGNGPLGEEMGWRGIMQSQLSNRLQRVWVALIIGVVWALWHTPLFQFADFRLGLDYATFIPLYTCSLVLTAFTMAHLWHWSGGSLFISIFYHAMVNITTTQLTDTSWWDLTVITNLQLYGTMLIIFALIALLAEILHHTWFRVRTTVN